MVMKHIKLFENWAEELEVPEYMKEDGILPIGNYAANNLKIKAELQNADVDLGWQNEYFTNFLHFYELKELDFLRLEGYDSLAIDQFRCKHRLQDLEGIPIVRKVLKLHHTRIKSLKGLEDRKLTEYLKVYTSIKIL